MQINVKISQYAKHAAEIPLPKTCQSNRGPGGTGWGWCTKHWHLTRQVSEPLVALVVCGHCWSVLWSEGYCRRCEKRELKTWLSSWPTSFCQTPIEKRQCVRSLSPALLTNNEELISLHCKACNHHSKRHLVKYDDEEVLAMSKEIRSILRKPFPSILVLE